MGEVRPSPDHARFKVAKRLRPTNEAADGAHRTLPFGTVLKVQSGGRSIQVTVTDRCPFTGAFLDISPAAANALGCRCTHRNVTATVMQMGSGETGVASRSRQRGPKSVA
ncbi:RlpA-like double-psi beta-barrel domain-containing protein [Bradyrhizobium sp. AUGA SZCCT0240]|nr:RlpA-like double-psi beta-barrel domain-containing protein [Bradyrhizobium sp. AUGA SZCCT0160]MBR1200773.1 RlpA-like double-psi beta-barrel domain-containing protein [Bradyrhizobium sp. AUGA SZCCT0158]MBR1245155.1 RlpA-like double-psi beta-barrel domain-containing protein [Bradyrhizobium sp. AUGA SZCCT0274]MBR1258703.1 RlpA-like double-psi beta-barrel domain-containing protein [Bradyrhizobium sp. AUGA SZCCT0240]